MSQSDVTSRIEALVKGHPVVLFMKGNRRFPQCGFSAQVVRILDGHLAKYETVNVLSDPEIREGVKAYAQWPTIPQLYVKGEFVGGCDIVRELEGSGELARMLEGLGERPAPKVPAKPPTIQVSPAAVAAIEAASGDAGGEPLHLEIGPRYEYDLYFGPRQDGEVEARAGSLTVLLDPESASRAEGVRIDFVEGEGGGGFRIESPNEPPRVEQITPAELKAMLDAGEKVEVFDVRTPGEREVARIEGTRLLDPAGEAYLETLPKETPVVFHCHHGGRSQRAAEHYLGRGFRKVFNLRGGIDAWSQTVDPKVPRY